MFCPFCGVKNSGTGPNCFVCNKRLPNLDSDSTPAQRRITLSEKNKSSAPLAGLRLRLLALLIDAIFIAAILLIIGATLWSKLEVRTVNAGTLEAGVVSATLLAMLAYTWVLEGAFGATIGKAFAGVRVVRQDTPLSPGKRIGVIATWIATVSGAVWGAVAICPQWFRP